jgi:hypothetical protein
MSISAMKQALEALEEIYRTGDTQAFDLCYAPNVIPALRQAIAEAEKQEPYGYFRYDIQLDAWVQDRESTQGVAFYTAPPKREWVGLTDEDIYKVIEENIPPQLNTLFDMAKWVGGVIEAKLKEKNT